MGTPYRPIADVEVSDWHTEQTPPERGVRECCESLLEPRGMRFVGSRLGIDPCNRFCSLDCDFPSEEAAEDHYGRLRGAATAGLSEIR